MTRQRAQLHEHETRTQIIHAALALFAQEGFFGPSLRAVGKAAQQKNTAAVHYHFKDRDGLLQACLEHVLEALDSPQIKQRTIKLPTPPAPKRLHETLLEAFLPIFSLSQQHPDWGAAGIRFLARAMQGESALLVQQLEQQTQAHTQALIARLSLLLPKLPEAILLERYELATLTVIHATVASPYEAARLGRAWSEQEVAGSIQRTLDFIAGGFMAPCSPEP